MSTVKELEAQLKKAKKAEREAEIKAMIESAQDKIGKCFCSLRLKSGIHTVDLYKIVGYNVEKDSYDMLTVTARHLQPAKYREIHNPFFFGACFQVGSYTKNRNDLYLLGEPIDPKKFEYFFNLCLEESKLRVNDIKTSLKVEETPESPEQLPFLNFNPDKFEVDLPYVEIPNNFYNLRVSPFLMANNKYLISRNSLLLAVKVIEREKESIRFCASDCFQSSVTNGNYRAIELNKIIDLFQPHFKEFGIRMDKM